MSRPSLEPQPFVPLAPLGPLGRLALAGRALRSPNYRFFFAGQIISLVGNWMTQVATSWLVYRLTRDPLMLGFVTFAGQIPAFLLAPIAGVLIDRWDLRRTLIITQVLAMAQSLALAYLALSGTVTVRHLLVLYVIQGIINGFDMPARQSILSQLVTRRDDIANAIALNSSMFNLARLLGPSIAGFVIARYGEGVCFLVDGISYVAAVGSVAMIRLEPRPAMQRSLNVLAELSEGTGYAWRLPPIREILLLCAVISLMGIPFTVLMPVFATDVLHGGPQTLGMLLGGQGVGAFIGAALLASRRSVVGLGSWMVTCGIGFGLAVIAFALSRNQWLSVAMMGVAGLTMVIVNASCNTVIQTVVDDDKRGRVLALLMMCFLGMVPIGGLLFGELASPNRLGPSWTIILGALACIAVTLRFATQRAAMRAALRPILVSRGILPAIASGLETEGELAAPPERAG